MQKRISKISKRMSKPAGTSKKTDSGRGVHTETTHPDPGGEVSGKPEEHNVTISEICRRKLKEIPQLGKIESTITEMNKKLTILLKSKQKVKIVSVSS